MWKVRKIAPIYNNDSKCSARWQKENIDIKHFQKKTNSQTSDQNSYLNANTKTNFYFAYWKLLIPKTNEKKEEN